VLGVCERTFWRSAKWNNSFATSMSPLELLLHVINRRVIHGWTRCYNSYNTLPCTPDKRDEGPLTSFIDFTSICREHPYGSLRDAFTINDKGGARREGEWNRGGSFARHTPWKGNRIEMTPHGSRIRDTWPGDKARFPSSPSGS